MRIAREFISAFTFGPVVGSTKFDYDILVGVADLDLTDFSTPGPELLLRSFGQGFSLFRAEIWPYQSTDSDDAFAQAAGRLTSVTIADAPAPIPEPATLTLLSIGLATAGYRTRRRLRHAHRKEA
jgi:hypothetical protein